MRTYIVTLVVKGFEKSYSITSANETSASKAARIMFGGTVQDVIEVR